MVMHMHLIGTGSTKRNNKKSQKHVFEEVAMVEYARIINYNMVVPIDEIKIFPILPLFVFTFTLLIARRVGSGWKTGHRRIGE